MSPTRRMRSPRESFFAAAQPAWDTATPPVAPPPRAGIRARIAAEAARLARNDPEAVVRLAALRRIDDLTCSATACSTTPMPASVRPRGSASCNALATPPCPRPSRRVLRVEKTARSSPTSRCSTEPRCASSRGTRRQTRADRRRCLRIRIRRCARLRIASTASPRSNVSPTPRARATRRWPAPRANARSRCGLRPACAGIARTCARDLRRTRRLAPCSRDTARERAAVLSRMVRPARPIRRHDGTRVSGYFAALDATLAGRPHLAGGCAELTCPGAEPVPAPIPDRRHASPILR